MSRDDRATPTTVAVVLAGVGLVVASYLTAYQLHAFARPWDPVFGWRSSRAVLRSSFSRALPFPDAGVGVVGYLAESVLGVAVLARPSPRRRVVYVVVVVGMAVGSVGLFVIQLLVVGHLCALCTTSAVVSWVIAAIVAVDVRLGSNYDTM